jgi:hypothetical protein
MVRLGWRLTSVDNLAAAREGLRGTFFFSLPFFFSWSAPSRWRGRVSVASARFVMREGLVAMEEVRLRMLTRFCLMQADDKQNRIYRIGVAFAVQCECDARY